MFLWTGPLFKLGIVLEPSKHSISCLASQWEASIFPAKKWPISADFLLHHVVCVYILRYSTDLSQSSSSLSVIYTSSNQLFGLPTAAYHVMN